MDGRELYRFLRKLAVMSLPLVCVVGLYVTLDPFKAVWHYERYFEDDVAHVALNMGHVSTETFVDRNQAMHYDAFIFGNSRSQYWRTDDWKRHIGKRSRPFHYYGNGETLYGVEKYVKFIHDRGNSIGHALLIVDTDLLGQTKPRDGHLFCTPPRVAGCKDAFRFHMKSFVAFLNPTFVRAYLDFLTGRRLKGYMLENAVMEQPVVYHRDTNEVEDRMFDQAISDGTYYTEERKRRFSGKQHPDSIHAPVLAQENRRMLESIAAIFRQHHTRCKVVVSPLFHQIRINPEDVQVLEDIFGRGNVYDFSGKNDITSDYRNYYEDSHYRPEIARRLMDAVYGDSSLLPSREMTRR